MSNLFLRLFLVAVVSAVVYGEADAKTTLRVFTVATDISSDGFQRFNRSANVYGLKVEVLGAKNDWLGGDVRQYPGGGQKVNLLRDALKRYKDDIDLVVLFVDSYDVIFTATESEIVAAFLKFKANVVFSAEGFCWPDASLSSSYPDDAETGGKRFLNSGGFIGYAPQVFSVVTAGGEIANDADDQLYYTKIYLNQVYRSNFEMKLDHKANIFQNLNGAVGDVELKFDEDEAFVENTAYRTHPKVIHGNGPSKIQLNTLSSYLPKSWSQKSGCLSCSDNRLFLKDKKPEEAPLVLIGIFIEHATPFLPEFFENIAKIRYPKSRLALFIHNSVEYHDNLVNSYVEAAKRNYTHITHLPNKGYFEWKARELGMEECLKFNCDYYFSIDSEARLTNSRTLTHLIEVNKQVVAPLLVRYESLWSNFWGSLTADGFYSRSFDYMDIVKNIRRGVWNVPYISQAYLLKAELIRKGWKLDKDNEVDTTKVLDIEPSQSKYPSFQRAALDSDMAFSASLRDAGVFMYVSNLYDFGHLAHSEDYVTVNRTQPDLYELFNNRLDWERRYIHENWSKVMAPESPIESPCPDVYWFPLVTENFTKELIATMEAHGEWSDGSNSDERLAGGYEAVPTRDIHMNQVGLEPLWMRFLRDFVRPMQEKIFTGYFHDPPKSIMNFVVRYRPDEQPLLKPHHDSSTYTINLALNRPGLDYQGGGCHFIRYNCSVTQTRVGWTLIHPGRLTHYHEGLRVTGGTRYIMISFVDP